MTDLVKPNTVILCSAVFAFLMNPNGYKKDRYIGNVSNMLELPAKGVFSAKQVRVAGPLL